MDAINAENTRRYQTLAHREAATIGNGVWVDDSKLPNAGLGLFATKRFRKNSLVTALDGEVRYISDLPIGMSMSHARTLTHETAVIGNKHPFPGIGGGHFANDANGSKNQTGPRVRNNAKIINKRYYGGVFVVSFIQALRDIEPGEEILVSYGRTYWHTKDAPVTRQR